MEGERQVKEGEGGREERGLEQNHLHSWVAARLFSCPVAPANWGDGLENLASRHNVVLHLTRAGVIQYIL